MTEQTAWIFDYVSTILRSPSWEAEVFGFIVSFRSGSSLLMHVGGGGWGCGVVEGGSVCGGGA